jgi:hypothetical protein
MIGQQESESLPKFSPFGASLGPLNIFNRLDDLRRPADPSGFF